jgi:inhibitor of KinA sporulation pathway (predicted exonuclease)
MKYDKILIVDVEMTCWETPEETKKNKTEIIEIGIVEVETKGFTITRERTFLIKPKFSEVSDFCTNLTSITNKMLSKQGYEYTDVVRILKEKFGTKNKMYVGWGNDNVAFINQSELFSIENPFSNNYLNLSQVYSIFNNKKDKLSLSNIIKEEGLIFEGEAHRALVDAKNTYYLFKKMKEKYNI